MHWAPGFTFQFKTAVKRIVKDHRRQDDHEFCCSCEACVLRRFDTRADLGPRVGLTRLQLLERAVNLLGVKFDKEEEEIIRNNGEVVPRPF
jgi:hypothetical protein